MQWRDAVLTRLALLLRRRAAESRMDQEFRLHIEMETEHLIQAHGLAPAEARRRALAAFGGIETHKEALRDGRGLAWLGGLSLDVKLAVRMLARYPWLTVVGTAAIAFGIAVGVMAFEVRTRLIHPTLPLDDGSRIVGLRNWDAALNRLQPTTTADLEWWREELTRVEDVSGFISFSRNLITPGGWAEPETVAAMSASAFRLARVQPLLGRTLVEGDEEPGARPVVVLGHDLWRRRFSSDPAVVGKTIRLGAERVSVIGVMPQGFRFPAVHDAWVPLRRVSPTESLASVQVFGRLAHGASRSEAQAELSVVGLRAAADSRQTHEHLRPQVVPYATLIVDPAGMQLPLALGNVFVLMLLILVAANVGLLMFARAASREGEVAVRSALGASRGRIVAQLFVEGLVLAAVGVGVGLFAARFALRSYSTMREADSGQPLPFWMVDNLTPATVLYAGGLTILCAAIIGVLPALKVTGGAQLSRLRESIGGAGGFRFGGVWTVIIAVQVAATLMFPAAAFFLHRSVVIAQSRDLGFPSAEYLSARVRLERENVTDIGIDPEEAASRVRVREAYAELERRLSAEPAVTGVTFTESLPGTLHPRWRIEVDGGGTPDVPGAGHLVAVASVALDYFGTLGAPIIAGRNFTTADLERASGAVIVDQPLVNQAFGGRNPVGRRIRRVRIGDRNTAGPWLDVVGVVRDLGASVDEEGGVYRPLSADGVSDVRVAVHVRGNPESVAARLRTIATDVEPALLVTELMPLEDAGASGWLEYQYLSRVVTLLSGIALLLSLTAVYSVASFTVTRRTREIGVRIALGADRWRVLAVVLRRPMTQLGFGVAAGAILVAVAFVGLFEARPTIGEAMFIAAYVIAMMGVCLLACVVPTRRAFAIEPARVLSAES